MRYAQEQRLRIINELKTMFIEASRQGKLISWELLVPDMMMRLGCTRRKAAEYIQDLVSARFLTRVGDELQVLQQQL